MRRELEGPLTHSCTRSQGSRLGKHSLGSIPTTTTFAGVQAGLGIVPAGALSAARTRDELKGLGAPHLGSDICSSR